MFAYSFLSCIFWKVPNPKMSSLSHHRVLNTTFRIILVPLFFYTNLKNQTTLCPKTWFGDALALESGMPHPRHVHITAQHCKICQSALTREHPKLHHCILCTYSQFSMSSINFASQSRTVELSTRYFMLRPLPVQAQTHAPGHAARSAAQTRLKDPLKTNAPYVAARPARVL